MVPGFRDDDLVRYQVLAGGRTLVLQAPTDPERLRDPFGRPPGEKRLPFWARLWPGGVVLARHILSTRPFAAGDSVIELGSGLGTAGIAAALTGAEVTLTDEEPEAVLFAAANAAENGVACEPLVLPWAQAAETDLAGRFAGVIGSELVYDRTQLPALARAIASLLAPGGTALIAEAERLGRAAFSDACAHAGLRLEHLGERPHPDGVNCADGAEPRPLQLFRLQRDR